MRLLFFDFSLPHLLAKDEFPVGGSGVQLGQWLGGLCDIGASAGVLTWRGANAHVGRTLPYELIETYDPRVGIRVLKYFYSYIPSVLAAARTFQPDAIVQSCASVHTGILAYVARRLGVPFVYRVASDIDVDHRIATALNGYERIAYRQGLQSSTLVICQNMYQAEQLKRKFPDKAQLLIQNCIGIQGDAAPPRMHREREYIAWLGIFRREKNLPLLARLAEALPAVSFRVAGIPQPDVDEKTLVALDKLRQLHNVHFTGYLHQADVPGFLGHATALLCTSDFEGFSNTFLEAFAAGTPVLTRKDVDPDLIVERNGLGCVADSERALADGIRRISQMQTAEFDDLAQRCRNYVEANHSPRAAMQKLVHAIGALIDDKGCAPVRRG
jgi:glycosyltransferase involved in cell wall biosynthesis